CLRCEDDGCGDDGVRGAGADHGESPHGSLPGRLLVAGEAQRKWRLQLHPGSKP
ncbi:unnamed protein product, partial [Effrenium voratum]